MLSSLLFQVLRQKLVIDVLKTGEKQSVPNKWILRVFLSWLALFLIITGFSLQILSNYSEPEAENSSRQSLSNRPDVASASLTATPPATSLLERLSAAGQIDVVEIEPQPESGFEVRRQLVLKLASERHDNAKVPLPQRLALAGPVAIVEQRWRTARRGEHAIERRVGELDHGLGRCRPQPLLLPVGLRSGGFPFGPNRR